MNRAASIFKAMRPHQWLKNSLIFLPLITSGHYTNLGELLQLSMGWCVFSLIASGVYIFNDIFDIESDRQHPTKKCRPFASGQVTIGAGVVVALTLFLIAGAVGVEFFPVGAIYVACAYLLCTFVYTLVLKKKIIADAVVLGILYTLRIIFGALLIGTGLSFWLLSFSLFCFTGLAFMKRVIELNKLGEYSDITMAKGRAYILSDKSTLEVIGIALSVMSVLIFCLYLNDVAVAKIYKSSLLLWAIVPALIYWHSRVWLLVDRGQVHEDPIVFAARDKSTWIVLVYVLIIIMLAGN